MTKIKLVSIKVITHNTTNSYKKFEFASIHIRELAVIFKYDHCQVQLLWEDLTTHEIEYDLYRDPFEYNLSKRAIFYLEQVAKGDKNPAMYSLEHVKAVQNLLAKYQLEDMLKVTLTQLQEIISNIWKCKVRNWDLLDKYELVLDHPPKHANSEINDFIIKYCDDSHINIRENIVYSGGRKVGAVYCDTFGEKRLELPASPEFKFVDEWCNGYREVFISEKDYVTLTICEGDLTIVVCEDQTSFAAELADAIECYGVKIEGYV